MGELDEARLLRLASTYLGPLGARLTMVGVGAAADAKLMEALARAAGGSYLAYLPGTSARGEALQILARQQGTVLEEVQVKLPEAVVDVAPRHLPSLHQGEELVLVGRARGEINGEVQLSGRVNGEPFRVSYAVKGNIEQGAGSAFLPRLWAQLSINALTNDDSIPETERRQRVATLSQQHQLLSRHTSLLVLESAAMRRAFGVVAVLLENGAPPVDRRAASSRASQPPSGFSRRRRQRTSPGPSTRRSFAAPFGSTSLGFARSTFERSNVIPGAAAG